MKNGNQKIQTRDYECSECGFVTTQSTNHTGSTWSWGHFNTCPKCPPYKKYPEYGGKTLWNYLRDTEK
tara:strand:- start:272 stop:475 length:204 start_codon:yes stop_codon:yes gene_type:complete